MKNTFTYWSIFILLLGCQSAQSNRNQSIANYKTVDYVEVGKIFPAVKAPYIIDVKNNNKRIVLIGCEHINDTTHVQFDAIEKYFYELQPQIAFNEGGQQSDKIHFATKNEAISKRGETGCLKYLSDRAGIRLLNGDIEDSVEFSITLKKHPKDKLFLYYIMERVVIPYLYGSYGNGAFEQIYEKAVREWFVANGFPLTKAEQDLTYFQNLYQRYMGVPFKLAVHDEIEKFDYVNGGDCEFCAIGRTSKMVRDSVLLSKIDQALDVYDRVMVTFGHGHALAVEPALQQIISRKR